MNHPRLAAVRLATILIAAAFAFEFNGPTVAYAQESGSHAPDEPTLFFAREVPPAESGSNEQSEGVFPIEGQPPQAETQKTSDVSPPDGGASALGPEASPTKSDRPPEGIAGVSPWLLLVIVFLAGELVVVWLLFHQGLFNPYTVTLWPKRLELCIEIALRTDDFMSAMGEANFNKCQMALEALNHLNGRRSILLSNEINAAVNQFVEQAIHAKVSNTDEAFQKDLNRKYELVIEALRVGTRQEELSLEVLRSLTKAQGPHRRLKEPASE